MSNANALSPRKETEIDPNPLTPKLLEQFLVRFMSIQKHYAYELRNVKGDRQGEVVELINKFAAKELNAQ